MKYLFVLYNISVKADAGIMEKHGLSGPKKKY